MAVFYVITSPGIVRGIPAQILQLRTNRAIQQVVALRAKAREVRPQRAARLLGVAEAVETALSDLAEALGDGTDDAIHPGLNRVRIVNIVAYLVLVVGAL